MHLLDTISPPFPLCPTFSLFSLAFAHVETQSIESKTSKAYTKLSKIERTKAKNTPSMFVVEKYIIIACGTEQVAARSMKSIELVENGI